LVKRSSFAKIGAIILSVVMGLGLMGIGVSYWSETTHITGTAKTGTWGVEVTDCTCSTPVTCGVAGNVLTVALTDAAAGEYSCDFEIENTGDIPVKIQTIVVDPSPPAGGVGVTTTDVVVGTQIDPGLPETGTVNIELDNAITGIFDFTVTFNVIPWNQ